MLCSDDRILKLNKNITTFVIKLYIADHVIIYISHQKVSNIYLHRNLVSRVLEALFYILYFQTLVKLGIDEIMSVLK